MPSATDVRRTTAIREALVGAVLAGARAVLAAKISGTVETRLKTAQELVTTADESSDAAILAVFETSLRKLDPEISFYLEESGVQGALDGKWAGADPLDGTNHFACGGNFYAIQAHYVENGIPIAGVICQPEVFLPLSETPHCVGRLVWAVRGEGAFVQQTLWRDGRTILQKPRRIEHPQAGRAKALTGCVPISKKMTAAERAAALHLLESGLLSSTTGLGSAAANILMAVFGGHHFYANFGAGEDLDIIPGQVIALEAGLAVCTTGGHTPVWHVRKLPVVVAQDMAIAQRVLEHWPHTSG